MKTVSTAAVAVLLSLAAACAFADDMGQGAMAPDGKSGTRMSRDAMPSGAMAMTPMDGHAMTSQDAAGKGAAKKAHAPKKSMAKKGADKNGMQQ